MRPPSIETAEWDRGRLRGGNRLQGTGPRNGAPMAHELGQPDDQEKWLCLGLQLILILLDWLLNGGGPC